MGPNPTGAGDAARHALLPPRNGDEEREPTVSLEVAEREVESVAGKLVAALRLRDPTLAAHGQRTAEIACAIGSQLGFSVEALDRLYVAGQLHDVGKLGVSEAILWKPAGLSHAEWREVRTHPEEGHRLVADVVHRDVAAAVLYHHERFDGEGYPYGIDARSVPLAARIVQVADAFDAMTSGRPYQPAVEVGIALTEVDRCAGAQFDPEVAVALRRALGVISRAAGPSSSPPVAVTADEIGAEDPFATPGLVKLRGRRA
jgi:HD-GYP domain-containing protein (c-di-GMP phosphodiesterase class II)